MPPPLGIIQYLETPHPGAVLINRVSSWLAFSLKIKWTAADLILRAQYFLWTAADFDIAGSE